MGATRPFHIYGTRTATTPGISDFLRANDKLSALLPAATRMATLEQDCRLVVPAMSFAIQVRSYRDGKLVLSVSSQAGAARLRQSVGKIEQGLRARGWNIVETAIKVGMPPTAAATEPVRPRVVPSVGVEAFDDLARSLAPTASNAGLVAAVSRLVAKRKK